MEETKLVALTKGEAETIMDSFKVSSPITRALVLKIASLVLEFNAQEQVTEAQSTLDQAHAYAHP